MRNYEISYVLIVLYAVLWLYEIYNILQVSTAQLGYGTHSTTVAMVSMAYYNSTAFPGFADVTFLICFEHIPDCFKYDIIKKNVVDEVGGLNSIIKPSSNDLVSKELLVAMRKLGRMTPFAPFLVHIYVLYDPFNGRPP
jgi:hypothetical protein